MIRVGIVDDHTLVRKGLVQLLKEYPDVQVVGELAHGRDVADLITRERVDVLLLDIGLPGQSGLDVLKTLPLRFPLLKVLVLTIYPEEQYAFRAMKLGAAGYLTKESAPEDLYKAILKVHGGGKYVTAGVAEQLAVRLGSPGSHPLHETLSQLEYAVFLKLAIGKTVKQIAQEMDLSVKTISTYRSRILLKMNMKDNSDMARYALREGLNAQ